LLCLYLVFFFFSSRRRHTRSKRDWSSDVCSSDLSWQPYWPRTCRRCGGHETVTRGSGRPRPNGGCRRQAVDGSDRGRHGHDSDVAGRVPAGSRAGRRQRRCPGGERSRGNAGGETDGGAYPALPSPRSRPRGGRGQSGGVAARRGRTGVEMEALTAVAVALLTVYDMVKAVDSGMVIGDVQLVEKQKAPRDD